jgi:spermidine synthase
MSGFAALLYQTAWLREFAFVFGTAELAVVSVLAAYMAGLAGGAALASRFASRIRRPVLVYGALELGIAVCALAVPHGLGLATRLYVFVFGGLPSPPDEGQLTGTLFFAVSSFLILVIPTGLMGITLPLLARYAIRKEEEVGSRIALLYAINTGGAVAGTLCAAFLLLPAIGLRSTVHVGVLVNGLTFVVAVLVARTTSAIDSQAAGMVEQRPGWRPPWILPAIAVSGAVSFGFEVLWTRLLGQILGGSVYAFATMLASFLLGIALGSAVASRFAKNARDSTRGFAIAQLGTAAASLAAYGALGWAPALAHRIGASSHGTLADNAVVAAAFLLPAALFIGSTFPFAVRILARNANEASTASARVYAWNTSGSIAGALSTGLLLLPELGFEGLIRVACATNLVLALTACWCSNPALRAPAAAAGVGLVFLFAFPPEPPWKILRTSPSMGAVARGEVTYYGVGRSSTVLLLNPGTSWRLTTGGLNEAEIRPPGSRPGQAATTRWLALLPILARPESEDVLLIGLGGGLTLQAIPSTVRHIDVIELESEVVEANRAVADERDSDPLADTRVKIHVNDARGALVLTTRRYDAIISQPSHPWTAGSSHLYTREFFSLVRDHLRPGGVFSQWIGLRFVDEDLLRTIVATLQDTFVNVRLYQPVIGSVVFLASDAELDLEDTAPRALAMATPDFARYGLSTPEDLVAGLALNTADAREFARGGQINTDHDNLLAARSPRLLPGDSMGRVRTWKTFAPFDPPEAHTQGLQSVYLARRLLIVSGVERANRFIGEIADPAEKAAAQGWVYYMGQRPVAARSQFERARALDPGSIEALGGLLMLERSGILRGESSETMAALSRLPAGEASIVSGWRARARSDPASLRKLDATLASLDSRHPLYAESARLRAAWRLASGEPELAREALAIIDSITMVRPVLSDLITRATAALAAGFPLGAVSSLEEVIPRIKTRGQAAGAALAVLDAVPRGVADATVTRLRRQLMRL